MAKWTVHKIRSMKGKEKIPSLTAFDFFSARMIDEADIPLLLVGDSLGMTVLGYETTLPVTLDDMLHHCKAVSRGCNKALIVADMPFLSYQASTTDAIYNAGPFLKEGGADAVKIEGGKERAEIVATLVQNGIPVMGHIGLTPQSVKAMGYKVQGKTDEARDKLIEDAKALEAAGVFAIVLEGMPCATAEAITKAVDVPTIGIGAGPHCDGQILVFHDLLGMSGDFKPKFVKTYAQLGEQIADAFQEYKKEVCDGSFPDSDHSY
jgi:3-methyl-2-oxobutanoate hydroxymethyltransferase